MRALVVLFLLLLPDAASAQLPSVRAWFQPLLAIPMGDFRGEIGAQTSPGFGTGAAVKVGSIELFGEYQRVAFDCGECDAVGLDDRVLDHGWGAGVIVPVRFAWAQLGVTGQQLRFSSDRQHAYSDPSLGWQAGVGATTRPLSWLTVEPSLVLRRHRARFEFGIDVPDRTNPVTFLALGVSVGLGL